jgi:hypothetical protein
MGWYRKGGKSTARAVKPERERERHHEMSVSHLGQESERLQAGRPLFKPVSRANQTGDSRTIC